MSSKRYATNPILSTLTATTQKLSTMNFVVDRMHFKGRIDSWCRESCDPDKLEAMKKVLTFIFLHTVIAIRTWRYAVSNFTVPGIGMCELSQSYTANVIALFPCIIIHYYNLECIFCCLCMYIHVRTCELKHSFRSTQKSVSRPFLGCQDTVK